MLGPKRVLLSLQGCQDKWLVALWEHAAHVPVSMQRH